MWRQSEHLHRQLTQRYHVLRKLNYALTRRKKNRETLEHQRDMACLDYLDYSLRLHKKAVKTLSLLKRRAVESKDLEQLSYFLKQAGRHINLVMRRVICNEYIPHSEKLFSLFEPHTEWINKGKAGVPVELGLRVCVLQDQFGFTLHHQVMEQQTDDQVAISMALGARAMFSSLQQVSFDKGFWSPANYAALVTEFTRIILPKKGRRTAEEKAREDHLEFKRGKRKHSAVESDINALEHHGLDKCPDHGIDGFKRYVAMSVLASNIHRLGNLLLQDELEADRRKKKRLLKQPYPADHAA
ncbi:MAG: hypothetical protein OFPII_36180 [Osedax symbiont Rs1]|nr:MAG: hypothetical protein OFPII_36180 [Osedax symbiont Rs1]